MYMYIISAVLRVFLLRPVHIYSVELKGPYYGFWSCQDIFRI